MESKRFFAYSLLLLAVAGTVLISGCTQENSAPASQEGDTEQQGSTATSKYADIVGTANARCTFDIEGQAGTWLFNGADFKLVTGSGEYAKKGDYIYIDYDEMENCAYYDIQELADFYEVDYDVTSDEFSSNSALQSIESWVSEYKDYEMSCQYNVVTAAQITAPEGCDDMTQQIKDAYEAVQEIKGQLCEQCLEDPETYGGDCSSFCE